MPQTNNITGALASLRAALPCPYVNMKSFSLLQQVSGGRTTGLHTARGNVRGLCQVWSLLESSGINPLELQREKQEVLDSAAVLRRLLPCHIGGGNAMCRCSLSFKPGKRSASLPGKGAHHLLKWAVEMVNTDPVATK